MKPELVKVSALIPAQMVPQFYRWVADSHSSSVGFQEVPNSVFDTHDPTDQRTRFIEVDPDVIRAWWSKLSSTASDVFVFLAHHAGEHFTSIELVERIEALDSVSAAAGTFTWPGRHATKMGFFAPWDWDGVSYSMSHEDASVLLAALGSVGG